MFSIVSVFISFATIVTAIEINDYTRFDERRMAMYDALFRKWDAEVRAEESGKPIVRQDDGDGEGPIIPDVPEPNEPEEPVEPLITWNDTNKYEYKFYHYDYYEKTRL